MRFSGLHWLGALIVSLTLHGLMSAVVADREPVIEIERGAGDPVAIASTIAANVSSVSSDDAGETAEQVTEAEDLEPTPAERVLDSTQSEVQDPVRPETEVIANAEAKPAESPVKPDAAPAPAETTQDAVPTETVAPRKSERTATQVTAELQPDEVNVETSDTVTADLVKPSKAEEAPEPAPAQTVAPRTSKRPAEQVVAALTPPAAEAETVRDEPARELLEPKAQPPLPRAKPEPEKPVEPARKKGRKKSNSAPSSGTTGSATKGRTKRASGDGGRNKTATGKADVSNYLGRVVSRLQRQKRYPSSAKRKKLQGTAVIAFTIQKNGRIAGVRLKRGSGHSVLDKEVLAMVRRASPFPPIPTNAGRRKISVSVPISFRVR